MHDQSDSFSLELSLDWAPWNFKASVPVLETELVSPHCPIYGKFAEDFVEGEVTAHPRGITFHPSLIYEFVTTTMETCPLFWSETYATGLGFPKLPVPPLMVLAAAIGLGVQSEAEQALSALGYDKIVFPTVTFCGDTIRSMSRILSVQKDQNTQTGIIKIATQGVNQMGEVVVQFERSISVPFKPKNHLKPVKASTTIQPSQLKWKDFFKIKLPFSATSEVSGWAEGPTFYEDFNLGQIICSSNGRTITEDHSAWAYRLGNTHPIHFDQIFAKTAKGPYQGRNTVWGAMIFAWIAGISSRDTSENMVWDLGYDEGIYHGPVHAGDTLYSVSRILDKSPSPIEGAGIITSELIGLKNISGFEALQKYGKSVFEEKPNRLDQIVFRIKRKILVRSRIS